ncbi:PAS domain S-box protein [Thermoleptolyngbya sp. M55_K2018_002]|uniref:PAS domain S-box protein n=1 Tax=Thermoleptolyngbya sp. M55_K2018_002 TaxID=2747808 RepID=UPI0019E12AF8|nr:PAS domain S-box protein [Thermoleptolyngbya sp. M55_K2018_002]HIK39226.1 PAS domain S-box protein [Thermoleptolyngbya sp. M55_K2018_002]
MVEPAGFGLPLPEDCFCQLFERSADAILLIDGDVFIDCNPAAIALLGCTDKAQVQSLHPALLSPMVQPDGRPSFETANEMMAIALRQGSHRFEWMHHRMNGEDLWVEVLLTAIEWQGRTILHATWRDIGDRLQLEAQRQEVEKALQRSEQRMRLALKAAQTGIWEWNIATDHLEHFSDEAKHLFGLTDETFDGTWATCAKAIHPEDVMRIERAIESAIAGTTAYAADYRVIWPDGSIHWLAGRGDVLWSEDGKPLTMVGTVQDITPRKEAEEARRHSEERFQAFMDHSPTATWMVSYDGQMLYINQTYLKMFTLPTPDVVGKSLFDLYPEEVAAEFLHNVQTVIHNRRLLATIEPIPLPDGTIGDSLVYKFPMSDGSGQQVVGGIAIDITDRKRAEEAIQDYADRQTLLNQLAHQIRNSLNLDTVLETTIQAVRNLLEIDYCGFCWVLPEADTPHWEIVQEAKNDHAPSLLGEYPLRLVGDNVVQQLIQQQMVWVDDTAQCSDPVFQALLTESGVQSVVLMPLRTHSQRIGCLIGDHFQQVRPWTERERDLLQSVATQLAIAIDQAELYAQSRAQSEELQHALQELQRTQAQMVQSEKMSSLGQLVAGIAHEINNPVNFIHGNLAHARNYVQDLLELVDLYQQEYLEPTPKITQYAEEIDLEFLREDLPKLLASMRVGTERIHEIVRSLRIFSRLDEAESKPVDIHDGIDSTLMILHNRLKTRPGREEIRVIKEYGSLPPVECYAGQLNQVFMNILSNAIDALEERDQQRAIADQQAEPSTICIKTQVLPDHQVSIHIIDNGPGMLPSVRQRIFDPFFTTKSVGKGTGMGMSISYQIVTEKHGGTLECFSEPGQGTEFVIQIPISQAIAELS